MSDSDSDEEFFDCESESVKYYAVAYQKNKGKGIVTTDINEARNKLKNSKGCRFTSFDDPLVAKKFAEKPLADESDLTNKKKSSSQKKVSDPFPNVSQNDLNIFKTTIEKGNIDEVKQIIWNNPRHLVTESDNLTILQIRFRFNALHIAVSLGRADVLSFVLQVLSQADFWRSIYPTSDEQSNRCRMYRVLDMYLNAPELGNLETPLHMASKFGHKDCLRVLLSQELTDCSLRNKFGFRANEVVCQRYTDLFKEQRSQDIRDIFSEKYVVLLGELDTWLVPPPMSHCRLLELLRDRNSDYQLTQATCPLETVPGEVRAYIGPVKEEVAARIWERWASVSKEDAARFGEGRRADAEKGMECHGRFLAQAFRAPWRELWRFLDNRYVDLCSEEGLSLLDEHLGRRDPDADRSALPDDDDAVVGAVADAGADTSSVDTGGGAGRSSGLSGLIRQFLRLTLGSSGCPQEPAALSPVLPSARRSVTAASATGSPSADWPPSAAPSRRPGAAPLAMATSTPLRPAARARLSTSLGGAAQRSLRASRTPFNASVSGAGLLAPVDRQVRAALLAGTPDQRAKHPRVASWLASLDEIDPVAISTAADSFCSPNGFLPAASTPIRRARAQPPPSRPWCQSRSARPPSPIGSGPFKVPPALPDLTKCLSPLSRIELSN